MPVPDKAALRKALRKEKIKAREALTPQERAEKSRAICANILQTPDEYVGKTARFVGYFAPFPDGEKNGVFTTGRVACEIPDQTNCCAQIIEFVLADPEGVEFPETGRRIIVQGTIDVFRMPYGMERCQLIDAVMDVQRGGI